ncbi:MAG TPA: SufE family protein [Opitutus sp.]|nr:SufE family protein [Opitutus sp.]
MRLNARQQALLEELELCHDPQERLAAIVDRARRRPPLSRAERTPERLVPGCSSSVWLVSEFRDDCRCYFRADADSPVVRGLVNVLADFYSGALAAEIAASDADPLATLDLLRTLSPTRQRGLAAVRAAITSFARAHLAS